MKTYITLDYELFFGESGSVEQSIVNPILVQRNHLQVTFR